jgi:molecular chaperone DnaK (HSP70)
MKLYFDRSTVEPPRLVETGAITQLRLEGGFLSTVRKPTKQVVYEGEVPLKPSDFVPGTARIVRHLLDHAEVEMSDRKEAVFGVPASFKDAGKKRLREAGKRGVLGDKESYEGVHLYYEPVAAARAYMYLDAGRTLVLDYGGGH